VYPPTRRSVSGMVWLLLVLLASTRMALAQPSPSPAAITPTPAPRDIVTLRAKKIFHSGNRTIAEGDVIAQSEGVQIEAQRMELDQLRRVVVATGNVRVLQGGDEVSAATATYNLDTRIADMTDAYGIARNLNLRTQPLQGEMYFWSPKATWDGKILRLEKGVVTTCDVPPPRWHYHASGDVVTVYPKDRIEISKARFFLGQKQLLGKNTLVISLKEDRRRQDLIPQVGVSRTDGVYVMEAVHYKAGKRDWGIVHLDYFQNAGLGYGLEHFYHLGDKGDGQFFIYDLPTAPTRLGRFEFRNTINYRFNPTTTGNLIYNSSQYFSPLAGVSTPANVFFAASLANSGRNYSTSGSAAFFSSGSIHNSSYSYLHDLRLSERLTNHFEAQYVRSTSAVSSAFYLHTLDRLNFQGDFFDSDLLFEQTSGSSLFLVNRRPEVQLRSRDLRLGGLPLNLAFSLGNFDEQPSGANAGRADIQINVPDIMYPLGKNTSVRAGVGFRQLFYTTGDAQYLGLARAALIQNLGENVRAFADYRYQRADGYTPLQSDFFGQYHAVSAGLQVFKGDWLRLGIDAGRDLEYDRFYNVQARLELRPWKRWRIATGARYDPNFGQFLNVDTTVRVPLSSTLSVQHYTLWDAVNKRLTYNDFMIQDDGHDWVTSLIYRSVTREFFLQLALKAFPFDTPSVGPNTREPILPLYEQRGFFR